MMQRDKKKRHFCRNDNAGNLRLTSKILTVRRELIDRKKTHTAEPFASRVVNKKSV